MECGEGRPLVTSGLCMHMHTSVRQRHKEDMVTHSPYPALDIKERREKVFSPKKKKRIKSLFMTLWSEKTGNLLDEIKNVQHWSMSLFSKMTAQDHRYTKCLGNRTNFPQFENDNNDIK